MHPSLNDPDFYPWFSAATVTPEVADRMGGWFENESGKWSAEYDDDSGSIELIVVAFAGGWLWKTGGPSGLAKSCWAAKLSCEEATLDLVGR